MFREENKIYAIIQTGGKQYKVSPGQEVRVDRLPLEEGNPVELNQVLMAVDEDKVKVGNPFLEGAKVVAKCLGEEKGDKVVVFRYKPKGRQRRKTGHRQLHTRLAIERIELN